MYNYLNGTTIPPVDVLDNLLSYLQVTSDDRKSLQALRDDLAVRHNLKQDLAPPIIEVTGVDGMAELANIEDVHEVESDSYDLAGPYEIVDLEEEIHVDAGRSTSVVICRRAIRATASGVSRFLYAFECSPESRLRRVMLDPMGTVAVSRVIRVGEVSYVFNLELAAPLALGEIARFQFGLHTFEPRNREIRGIYGKRQFVTTETVKLAFAFDAKARPDRVRWFAVPFPIGSFPDGYSFPDGNDLELSEGGACEKTFGRDALTPERIVGVVWDYQ